MCVRVLVMVIGLWGLSPRASFAQPASDAQFTDVMPDSDCSWLARTVEEEREVTRRLTVLQQEFDALPLKGPLISLVVSGVLTMGGILTAALYTNPEHRPVPPLWAIPGVAAAGVVGSAAVLALRLRQRAPFKARRKLLLRQQAQLASRRETYANKGCSALPDPRISAARATEIDDRLSAVRASAQEISLAGPALLLGLGAAGVASALVTGIVLLLDVSAAEDHSEPVDRTPMRVAFGMIPVGAAALAGGGVWLSRRRHQRRAIMETGRPLEHEKQRLDIELAPQVGPSSLGVTWRGRF